MALVVVVRGVDQGLFRKREDFVVDRAVERRRIAVLEIRSPATVDQQGIAGEYARRAVPLDQIGMVVVRVPRCVERPSTSAPKSTGCPSEIVKSTNSAPLAAGNPAFDPVSARSRPAPVT